MYLVDVLDLANTIGVQRKNSQVLILGKVFNFCDFVVVNVEVSDVGILHYVLNARDLVVAKVNPFKRCWWIKVEHFCN